MLSDEFLSDDTKAARRLIWIYCFKHLLCAIVPENPPERCCYGFLELDTKYYIV